MTMQMDSGNHPLCARLNSNAYFRIYLEQTCLEFWAAQYIPSALKLQCAHVQ